MADDVVVRRNEAKHRYELFVDGVEAGHILYRGAGEHFGSLRRYLGERSPASLTSRGSWLSSLVDQTG